MKITIVGKSDLTGMLLRQTSPSGAAKALRPSTSARGGSLPSCRSSHQCCQNWVPDRMIYAMVTKSKSATSGNTGSKRRSICGQSRRNWLMMIFFFRRQNCQWVMVFGNSIVLTRSKFHLVLVLTEKILTISISNISISLIWVAPSLDKMGEQVEFIISYG